MTDLETQLRAALQEAAPEHVDTTTLAPAARTRAARRRRHAITGAALAVVSIAGITAAALLGSAQLRADERPARPSPSPSPTVTVPADQTLCQLELSNTPGSWADARQPSTQLRTVVLCPNDPADPAWADLPKPAAIHGSLIDTISTGGVPPVETCDGGRPNLPAFRLVTVGLDGNTTKSHDSASMKCAGAQTAQSFAAALAEARFEATATPGAGCADFQNLSTVDPPRRFTNAAAIDVCVTASPYTEAEPAPLRLRPFRAVRLDATESQAVLDGLANATMRNDRYTSCPWRHATIKVVATTPTGARSSVILMCQQDFRQHVDNRLASMPGQWPVLDSLGQAILEREAASYLAGGRPN